MDLAQLEDALIPRVPPPFQLVDAQELAELVIPEKSDYQRYSLWIGLCTVIPALCGMLAIGKLSEFWDRQCFRTATKPTRTAAHLYPKILALIQFVLIYITGPVGSLMVLSYASMITEQSQETVLAEAHNVIHWDSSSVLFNRIFNVIKLISVIVSVPSFIGLLYPSFGVKSTEESKHYDDRTLIVFRWVTRGSSPDLIRTNMVKNWRIIKRYNNIKMEVVTDKAIGVNPVQCGIPSHCFDEIVVPQTFRSPNSTLFKARALYYASVHSKLATGGCYIFHCDEESTVTDQLMIGVKEFVTAHYGKIGQGLITYRNDEYTLSSYLCHLADSMRPAEDIGRFRLQFGVIGRAVFGLKGSFVLVPSYVLLHFQFQQNSAL